MDCSQSDFMSIQAVIKPCQRDRGWYLDATLLQFEHQRYRYAILLAGYSGGEGWKAEYLRQGIIYLAMAVCNLDNGGFHSIGSAGIEKGINALLRTEMKY